MKLVFLAITLLPCQSVVVPDQNTSVVYVCPDTAKIHWREIPETPIEVARFKHIQSIARYDLPPFAKAAEGAAAEKPKAEKAKTKKKASATVKKAKKKKVKYKKKRRRG